MHFIVKHPLADGSTPIDEEDAGKLRIRISTMGELNRFETQNIIEARVWAFDSRTVKNKNPIDESYVRELHKRMFGKVWKWAGVYRNKELNIGCDPAYIRPEIRKLLDDTQYWLAHNTFLVDEVAIRLHHRLVSKIHGFPNGNGRHARMLADVIAVKYGQPEFTWGKANLGEARAQYLTALRAMDGDPNNVQPLLQFARL